MHKTVTFVDPDLGWHLRAGEIVLQTGSAPTVDPWNYVINDQEWINHEWLLDLFLWSSYASGNWNLVILLFFIASFIPIAIWIFRARSQVQLLFVAMATSVVWTVIGVRPQVLSILFFFLMYEALFSTKTEKVKQILYLVAPFFFAMWANIHAGFVAGLTLWVLVFCAGAYQRMRTDGFHYRAIMTAELLSIIVSTLATLLTPYHLALWREIIVATTTPIITHISEWKSPFSQFNILSILFLASTAGLVLAMRKTLPLRQLVVFVFFFISYAQYVRMAPFFIIVALPLIAQIFSTLKENTTILLTELRPRSKQEVLIIPSLLLFITLFYSATSDMLRQPYRPPSAAIAALQTIPRESCNVFNDYGFGGWMIFQNPNEKLFIDGRGPHWVSKEGISPFKKYIDFLEYPETLNRELAQYNVCVAILQNPNDASNKKKNEKENSSWEKILAKIRKFLKPEDPPEPPAVALKKSGWCEVYTDSLAVILIRPGEALCDK